MIQMHSRTIVPDIIWRRFSFWVIHFFLWIHSHNNLPGLLGPIPLNQRHFSGVIRSAISSVICTSCSAQSCTAFSNCLDMDNKWTAWGRTAPGLGLEDYFLSFWDPDHFQGRTVKLRGSMTPRPKRCNIIRDVLQIYHRLTSTLIPQKNGSLENPSDLDDNFSSLKRMTCWGATHSLKKMFVTKQKKGGGFQTSGYFLDPTKKQPGLRIIPHRFHVSLNGNFQT